MEGQIEPQKSNNALGILLTFVITALVVGGATYYWQQTIIDQKVNQAISEVRQETNQEILDLKQRLEGDSYYMPDPGLYNAGATDVGLEEIDVPDGWRAYKNQDIGVAFAYPEDKVADIAYDGYALKMQEENLPGFQFYIYKKFIDEGINLGSQHDLVTEVKLGNKTYTRYGSSNSYAKKSYTYYIEHDGYNYFFTSLNGPEDKDFDKLVSTVKFIDVFPDEWTVFNKDDLYSIKFPASWKAGESDESISISYTNGVRPMAPEGGGNIRIYSTDKALEGFIQELKDTTQGFDFPITQEQAVIDGKQATKLIRGTEIGLPTYYIFIPDVDVGINLVINYYEGDVILRQIVETIDL